MAQVKKRYKRYVDRKGKINDDCERIGVPSTCPDPEGIPNPMYSMVLQMMSNGPEYEFLANRILEIAQDHIDPKGEGPNMFNKVAIFHDPRLEEVFLEYKRLAEQRDAVPADAPVMPKPPLRETLYERVADKQDIIDLGSGGQEILNQHSHLYENLGDVVCVDPVLPESIGEKITTTNRSINEVVMMLDHPVVGFNSLTQLSKDEMDTVFDTDGMFIYPDIEVLEDGGIAVPTIENQDLYVTVAANGKVFTDAKVVLPHYKIKYGYCATNTYKSQKVDIMLNPEPKSTEFQPQPDAVADPIQYYGDDVGYKHDGEFRQLHVRNGVVRMFNRSGTMWTGSCPNRSVSLIIDMEEMTVDEVSVFVCLRVRYYNGLKPFHSGDLLRTAMDKIKIYINGSRVHGPLRYDMGSPCRYDGRVVPVDGIVIRYEQRDYYRKDIWTIDTKNINELQAYFNTQGVNVDVVDEIEHDPNDIVEWTVMRDLDDFSELTFTAVRVRRDKTNWDLPHEAYKKLKRLWGG